MRILVLGSGGREHALSWRLSQDKSCQQVLVWPGNAGMNYLSGPEAQKISCLSIAFSKESLKDIIEIYRVELVIPGAEKYLYAGVSDWCDEWRVPCLGPSQNAASLERSKIFSKKIMQQASIPTARFTDLSEAYAKNFEQLPQLLSTYQRPVIKISGPSLGKGVFVCADQAAAVAALQEIKQAPMAGLEEGIFVEEGLSGKEISLFYACHNENYLYLGAAQDHKRLLDNDQGPNTGGMGTISPVSWASGTFIDEVTELFLKPTLKCMQDRGTPFKGVLFLGLMVNADGSQLLEYNVRFGDPETQVIMPLLVGDLSAALLQLCQGHTPNIQLTMRPVVAVHVVKAARGYPGLFGEVIEKNQKIIADVTQDPDTHFFFAGVRRDGDELLTDGGRVLGVTALAATSAAARTLAYHKLQQMRFPGEQFRQDIGVKT